MSDGKPWITIRALRWLEENVQQGWKVFEYGMGGSTLFFADRGCQIVSVEHHKDWYEKVKNLLQENTAVSTHLAPPLASGGNAAFTSDFGEWQGMTFETYVRIAETVADQSLDLALVDGRARVPCIKAIKQKIKPDGYILLDNAERPRYQEGIDILQKEGWKVIHFTGPGYFEKGSFWCTTLFQKRQFP